MTAQHTDEEGDDTLYDERIAIGSEYVLQNINELNYG